MIDYADRPSEKMIPDQHCLTTMNVIGRMPCETECHPEGRQHSFEGEMGLLPPYLSLASEWEVRDSDASYEQDGADSPITSVTRDGLTVGSFGDRASLRNPPGPDEIIFRKGRALL